MKASIETTITYTLTETEQLNLEVLFAFVEEEIEKGDVIVGTADILNKIISKFTEARYSAQAASEIFVVNRK